MNFKAVPIPVMVVAVLGVLYGAFWLLCCGPLGTFGAMVPQEAISFGTMTIQPPNHSPVANGIIIASFALSVINAAVLLAGSIGSFYLKPWARLAMIAFAVLAILITVSHSIAALPGTMVQAQSIAGAAPAGMQGAQQVGMVIGGLCGAFCACLYPIAILVIYNLAAVKEAFATGGSGGGYPPYGGGPGGDPYAQQWQAPPAGPYGGYPPPQPPGPPAYYPPGYGQPPVPPPYPGYTPPPPPPYPGGPPPQ